MTHEQSNKILTGDSECITESVSCCLKKKKKVIQFRMRNELFSVICKTIQQVHWKDSANCLVVNAWKGVESRQPYYGLECGK